MDTPTKFAEFLGYILGTNDWPLYGAQWFFALIGVALTLSISAAKRNPARLDTPDRFQFKFLIRDNWGRLISTFLLLFIFLRFPEQLLKTNIENVTLRLFLALMLGVGSDQLGNLLQKINFLGLGEVSKAREVIQTKRNENPTEDPKL